MCRALLSRLGGGRKGSCPQEAYRWAGKRARGCTQHVTRKDEAGVSPDARQGALKREGSLGAWERLPGGGADSWSEKSGRISSLYSANQLPLPWLP